MIKIQINDTVRLKKKHPCGSDLFQIEYLASDVKIVCNKCGRDIIIPRVKFEKSIKEIIKDV